MLTKEDINTEELPVSEIKWIEGKISTREMQDLVGYTTLKKVYMSNVKEFVFMGLWKTIPTLDAFYGAIRASVMGEIVQLLNDTNAVAVKKQWIKNGVNPQEKILGPRIKCRFPAYVDQKCDQSKIDKDTCQCCINMRNVNVLKGIEYELGTIRLIMEMGDE